MIRQAYTSTVVSPVLAAVGVVAGAAVAAGTAVGGLAWWWALASGVLVMAASVPMATVHLRVGGGRIRIRHGWGLGGARVIGVDDVCEATVAHLSWPQVLGVGVEFHRRTTRSSVRAGPTLCLRLADGERVRVSTPFPWDACHLIDPAGTAPSVPPTARRTS